jgi:DNA-binding MarR family transcriptional regulator
MRRESGGRVPRIPTQGPNDPVGGTWRERGGESTAELIRWIIWYVRRLVQAGDIYSKGLHKKYQVSQPQVSCILALDEYGAMPISKLAKYILVKPSTVTGIIDRLELKGLVIRTRNLADRRVVTIDLTDAGKVLAAEAPPPIPKEIVDSLKELSPQQVKNIVESLAILVSKLPDDKI